MDDSLLSRLRAAPIPLLLGLAAGGFLMAAGSAWLWGGLALAALAVLALRLAPAAPRAAAPVPASDPGALPALVRAVIEHLPAPVLLVDTDERVVFANEPMRAVLGNDPERKHLSAVLRNPAVLGAIARTLDTGEADGAAFTLPVPIARHFESHTARMEGGMVALLLHDVTAIRRAEQMRADFVANASHELRTPLAAVSGFIDTLRGHAKDDEAAREQFLGIMSVEAARMRRLIEDLLSLTRIELNEHVRPEARVGLGAIVREAAAALNPLAAQDRITITVTDAAGRGGEDLPDMLGDHDELVQLFQNLIHNAIKYGREDGQVTVTLAREGKMLVAAVKDDGEGIPQTALPRLTERFYRVDVKRSRERGGTGLGLAIVKHIVSRHGGRLTIDSRVGEGSTFTVFLPASKPETPAKSAAALPVADGVTEVL